MANRKAAADEAANGGHGADHVEFVSISQETRRRYLNYALSVIQSRALPDVRDGLKPVQRRIMYVMYEDLRLLPDRQTRKCAKITGDTTGNYHPHGTAAVYDALVRLAQDFTLREPLVDGQGNFGSIIGLPPAAERYTEARLTPIAVELMEELRYDTVEMRPTYDGVKQEPVVLPARFPNLLVNGIQGIAVGMATSLPPHNLAEVIKGCLILIDNREATVAQVMKAIKAPDFPLGGRIVTDRAELRKIYETGRGAIKVRAEWDFDKVVKGKDKPRLVIKSVPYGVETGPLVSQLGDVAASSKLPQLLEVNDETDDSHGLRIVLDIKSRNDADAVMAYLFKHTQLEQNFSYNSTCLVPGPDGGLVPAQVSLTEMLNHFLDFRLVTVRKRFEYILAQLERRIHILEGFEIVFNGLDKALKLIRESNGKQDAAEKLINAFPLDEVQANAILELQLYRISRLEIDDIRNELADKRKEAKRIRGILASEEKLWGVVKEELGELREKFGNRRRTAVGSSEEIEEFDPQAYIVKENTNVVLTADGWVKRVGRIQSVEKSRVREGDSVIDVIPGSTLDMAVFFASDGVCYTLPIEQIPVSSGYGEPLSKHVKLKDGVHLLKAITTDARFTAADREVKKQPSPAPWLMVATRKGQVMRISLSAYRVASTKSGRKFCRLGNDDSVVAVELIPEEATTMFLATQQARVIHFTIEEVPVLSGPGKGVRGIRLEQDDEVLGMKLLARPSDTLYVINENDKQLSFGQTKYGVTSRGGRGVKTSTRTDFKQIIRPPIELIDWQALDTNGTA